ncbi:hypothetical protein NIES970_29240 (plasmid) [[Synechococcus] sp. NIES-970]|nr:hypothetical protein NIES970_29240 [[Synechococcus] sp. NIES-970]
MTKKINELNYREWQARNTSVFSKLDHSQQKKIRQKGYKNRGWLHVQNSWKILNQDCDIVSLFDKRLNNDDLLGAIEHSILEANQASELAQESLKYLENQKQKIKEMIKKNRMKLRNL